MDKLKFRKLNTEEIRQLSEQGCYCRDWEFIEVVHNFTPEHLKNLYIYGLNRIKVYKYDFFYYIFGFIFQDV